VKQVQQGRDLVLGRRGLNDSREVATVGRDSEPLADGVTGSRWWTTPTPSRWEWRYGTTPGVLPIECGKVSDTERLATAQFGRKHSLTIVDARKLRAICLGAFSLRSAAPLAAGWVPSCAQTPPIVGFLGLNGLWIWKGRTCGA
jgi:hypothetical protein